MPPRQRTHPPGRIYQRAAQFQDELELGQQAAADQILAAYGQAYAKIRGDYQALLDKIKAAREAGEELSPAWLYQQERYKAALDRTKRELHKYAQDASSAAVAAQDAAVRASARHHAKLGQEAVSQAAHLSTSFVAMNEANTRHLVGFLADGSPLADLFSTLAADTAEAATKALVEGIALGKGPVWMARQLTAALDMPRHRAVTIMRTETMRTYRAVARETYQANADVLEGWTWHAKLAASTCAACLAMHGTVHPVTETLDGHPRCRCAMVPRTKSWDEILGEDSGIPDTRPPLQDGKKWLAEQPERTQRAILGPAKLKAWRDGKITLDDVVARTESRTWGTMRRERSLIEIEQGRNANTLPEQATKPSNPTPARPARRARKAAAPRQTPTPPPPATPPKAPGDALLSEHDARMSLADAEAERAQARKDMAAADQVIAQQVAAERVPPSQVMLRVYELRKTDPAYQAAEARLGAANRALLEAQAKLRLAKAANSPQVQALPRKPAARHNDGAPFTTNHTADMSAANPGYGQPGYNVNCVHVVNVMELRARGFNVTATPLPQALRHQNGRNAQEALGRWSAPDGSQRFLWPASRTEMERTIKSEWPEGARGWVSVQWKGPGGGHIFNVRKEGGRVVYYDGQINQVVDDPAAYWRRVKPGRDGTRFARVDDLIPTDEMLEFVNERGTP